MLFHYNCPISGPGNHMMITRIISSYLHKMQNVVWQLHTHYVCTKTSHGVYSFMVWKATNRSVSHSSASRPTWWGGSCKKRSSIFDLCQCVSWSSWSTLVEFIKYKNGKKYNNTVAFLDTSTSVVLNGEMYSQTVRSSSCELLTHVTKCSSCVAYRDPLRVLYNRWKKKGKAVHHPSKPTLLVALHFPIFLHQKENKDSPRWGPSVRK